MTTYRDVVQAFKDGRKASAGNYFTDGNRLYLFGNMIAERTPEGKIRVSDAGYPTHTTHKALRALGVNIRKKKFKSYINDEPYESGSTHEIQARKGYHGIIRKPTRFLVGEAGSERVNISPIGKHHHHNTGIKLGKINLGNIKIKKFV